MSRSGEAAAAAGRPAGGGRWALRCRGAAAARPVWERGRGRRVAAPPLAGRAWSAPGRAARGAAVPGGSVRLPGTHGPAGTRGSGGLGRSTVTPSPDSPARAVGAAGRWARAGPDPAGGRPQRRSGSPERGPEEQGRLPRSFTGAGRRVRRGWGRRAGRAPLWPPFPGCCWNRPSGGGRGVGASLAPPAPARGAPSSRRCRNPACGAC